MMSRKPVLKSRTGLLWVGLLAGLLVFWAQRGTPVTAGEPAMVPQAIKLSTADLNDGAPQSGLPEVAMTIGNKTYTVEVTTTPEQARKGLMYRTELAGDRGMLFQFRPARGVNFWMKNTKIPLDMIFLNRGRVVHVVQGAAPCLSDPCPSYSSMVPVDMVVEVPAGTAKKDGIQVGAPARIQTASSPAETQQPIADPK